MLAGETSYIGRGLSSRFDFLDAAAGGQVVLDEMRIIPATANQPNGKNQDFCNMLDYSDF